MKLIITTLTLLLTSISLASSFEATGFNQKRFFCEQVDAEFSKSEGPLKPPLFINMEKCLSSSSIKINSISYELSWLEGQVELDTKSAKPYPSNIVYVRLGFSGNFPNAKVVGLLSYFE